MFGKNKLQPSTFKTIAALTVIPQEVREGTETSDDQFICPIHGEVKRRKSQQRYVSKICISSYGFYSYAITH